MAALTIQDVARRSGLSEPTLRCYEQVVLVGPIEAEIAAQHARLACLSAKAAPWDARDRDDTAAEAAAMQQVIDAAGGPGFGR